MRQERGFVKGVLLPMATRFFLCLAIAFVLWRGELSFSFRGKDILKPLWETITDKVVTIAKVLI